MLIIELFKLVDGYYKVWYSWMVIVDAKISIEWNVVINGLMNIIINSHLYMVQIHIYTKQITYLPSVEKVFGNVY